MKFVPGKSLEQQDIQALHRGRERLVNHRTALVAQMGGRFSIGCAFRPADHSCLARDRLLLEEGASELSELFRSMLAQLYACLLALDSQIAWFDREIEKVFRSSETCRRLAQIRGVGPKTAHCHHRRCRRRSRVHQRQASRSLDGARASTPLKRQPATPVRYFQARGSSSANAAHPRRPGCSPNFTRPR